MYPASHVYCYLFLFLSREWMLQVRFNRPNGRGGQFCSCPGDSLPSPIRSGWQVQWEIETKCKWKLREARDGTHQVGGFSRDIQHVDDHWFIFIALAQEAETCSLRVWWHPAQMQGENPRKTTYGTGGEEFHLSNCLLDFISDLQVHRWWPSSRTYFCVFLLCTDLTHEFLLSHKVAFSGSRCCREPFCFWKACTTIADLHVGVHAVLTFDL